MYLRQSKDDELAIDRQREGCAALCRERGWSWYEYPDNDRSATNGRARPQYQQMLKDIRAGRVNAVVVNDLDRLHRKPIELEHFMQLADERQLKLATVTGDCDLSTDNGRLFARIKGAVAMSEVERKSARQKSAHKQLVEAPDGGRPWWPSRPFGYDADPDPVTQRWWTVRRDPKTKAIIAVNKIRKHRKEAKLVKDAYRDFNAGKKLRTIATDWNEAGITTPRGNAWSITQVRDLLLAARNAGIREYEGHEYKGTWPVIVDEDVWRQAVRTLQDPTRRSGATGGRKFLLSGIARCGREGCGGKLSSTVSSRKTRQYVCTKCQRIARDGVKLDEVIIEAVVRRLSEPDAVDLLRPPVDAVDAEGLREERRSLRDKLAQLGKDFATAPPEFTQAAVKDIQGKLDAIDAVLTDPGKAAIFEDLIGAKDVRKAFDSLDLGRQRTIVDTLMTIRVLPVGKGTGRVFDPAYIDVAWKEDL